MARKKRTTKKSHSRKRRRVSGMALSANSPLVNYGGIAAGYLLGDKINEKIVSMAPTMDPKILAAVQGIAGYLLRSKAKGAAAKLVGGVLMGSGLKSGLKAFNIISGLPVVAGYVPGRTIQGLPAMRRVAGVANGQSNSLQVIGQIGESAYTDNARN